MHSIGDAWEGVVVVGSSGFKLRVWEGSVGGQADSLSILLVGMACTCSLDRQGLYLTNPNFYGLWLRFIF